MTDSLKAVPTVKFSPDGEIERSLLSQFRINGGDPGMGPTMKAVHDPEISSAKALSSRGDCPFPGFIQTRPKAGKSPVDLSVLDDYQTLIYSPGGGTA